MFESNRLTVRNKDREPYLVLYGGKLYAKS